jgi:hypothetical protein
MKDDPLDVRQAIADVALLRRVLHQIEQKRTDQESAGLFGTTLNANMLLQGGALCIALALAIVEIFSDNVISRAMLLGNESVDLRLAGIGIVALMLLGMITALYFVLWRAARHNGEEFGAYIARNFRYARHVSYLSDLLMKFVAVALVLLAGQSQWVAPLLMAFTGDYLLQGRLFTLPTKIAVALGVICIGGALLQFLNHSESLLIPLALFSVISAFSVGRLIYLYKNQGGSTA